MHFQNLPATSYLAEKQNQGQHSGATLILYGSKYGNISKEIKLKGGELMTRFIMVINEIKDLLKGHQSEPLKHLSYDYETLWLFSWGIWSKFEHSMIIHDGTFESLAIKRPVLFFLPKII
jgi:hypothetical protein